MKRLLCLLCCFLLLCGCQPAIDPPPEDVSDITFRASVTDVSDDLLTVIPLQGEQEYNHGNTLITMSIADLDAPIIRLGDVLLITYDGQIMETYPAQIRATAVSKVTTRVNVPFEGQWLDKTTAEYYKEQTSNDYTITAVYSDCFFAVSVTASPYVYKIDGTLSEEWCIGDQVLVTQQNTYFADVYSDKRAQMDLVSVTVSKFVPDPEECAKPVVYLYPEKETVVDVTLTLDGELTCTYPAYQNGWRVTASPDGTLTDANGQTYNYLYWEGETNAAFDMSSGFCVKGDDTAAFLETALADLGLTRREANEFIVYWLPLMQENPYNVIAFQTDAYEEAAKLTVSPTPDTLIRVFMTYTASDTFVELPPQELTAPERVGFTVVEWGGTQR